MRMFSCALDARCPYETRQRSPLTDPVNFGDDPDEDDDEEEEYDDDLPDDQDVVEEDAQASFSL